MKNFRTWGKKPFKVAVVHGGPGAPGYIAPVAEELSKTMGVLEHLQTKNSIDGQVEELADVLNKQADIPVVLIGHSWGATLSYITTARHPHLVKKLVLVGTVPLEGKAIQDYTPTWLSRLSEEERVEFLSLEKLAWDGGAEDKSAAMGRLFRLITKAEAYEPIPHKNEVLEYQLDINMAIGLEVKKLLAGGELKELGSNIVCPVVVIHGDFDVRPADAVKGSLSRIIKDFKFVLLEKCGHFPWIEKYARDEFFDILKKEI